MNKNLSKILLLASIGAMPLGMAAQQASSFVFSGKVKDIKGKGIAGVVVNNGRSFVQTNSLGEWTLPTDTNVCKFVSISTPSSYVLPCQKSLAKGFYVRVDELVKDHSRHDFILEKRKKLSDKFYYIAISDPQVKNEHDMKRWKQESIRDLKGYVDTLSREREVVANTLGDLVFDSMNLYGEYAASFDGIKMTTFQCIGNHDFDKRYQDLHNMILGTPVYGEQYYHRFFGPVNYSYNIGKVHVVTLKNINYVGHKKYIEAITDADLDWLKHDLSFVPKGSLVFLNMHAAVWNSTEGEGNVRNAEELADALKDYQVHVLTGHTHYFQNNVMDAQLLEHNIGAACGAWWKSQVNRCGAPNGYLVMDVDGNQLKWHYKSTGHSIDYQMRVYGKGNMLSQPQYVVVNVWDWDPSCKVEWLQDGQAMGEMEKFVDVDEAYAASKRHKEGLTATGHLFRALPSSDAKNITVVFTNRFGEKYEQTVLISNPKVKTQIIAHRGYWDTKGSAQNSIASLRKAADAKVYGSECDVHITADSVIIVNHDPKINDLIIADSKYADLKIQLLKNGEEVSTLEQYLNELKNHPAIKLILEIKRQPLQCDEDRLTRKTVEMVNRMGLTKQVEYISFSSAACALVRQLDSNAVIYYVNGNYTPAEVKKLGYQGIDYSYKILFKHPEWIKEAHELGLKVNGWTSDDDVIIKKLIEMNVDFITTNKPVEAEKLARKF